MTAATLSRKSKAAAPVNEPVAPVLPWWHAPTEAARYSLSTLLNEACSLDLPDEDNDSNCALRLLGLAARVVDDDMITDGLLRTENPQNLVADACFNCIALLRATLVHPDGTFDIRRRTWVLQALSILDVLTDLHMTGPQGTKFLQPLEHAINVLEVPGFMPAQPSVPQQRSCDASTCDSLEDANNRRVFALECVTQIGELADGLKVFEAAESDDRSPFVYGVCSRIALLATLIFHAQRLHGDPDEQWGDRTVSDLQAAFAGRFV